jgi:hypothetical protein
MRLLARPHEGLDLVLRGRGRGVEHLALAVAVRRVHTVQENGVQMRVEPQVTVGALNDGHGAGLAGRQAAVNVAAPIPPCHGVREDAHHLTEQFPVEGEREAQRERAWSPRTVGEARRARRDPPGSDAPSFMRLPRQLGHTALALHEKATHGARGRSRSKGARSLAPRFRSRGTCAAPRSRTWAACARRLVGPLLLEGQQVLLQHLIKGSLLRLPARVDRAGRRRLCACRCLHRGGLSASGSPKVRAVRDLQPDR